MYGLYCLSSEAAADCLPVGALPFPGPYPGQCLLGAFGTYLAYPAFAGILVGNLAVAEQYEIKSRETARTGVGCKHAGI
jgi:hypothetical protein